MINQQNEAVAKTRREVDKLEKLVIASYAEATAAINKELKELYAIKLSEIAPKDRYNYMIRRGRLKNLKKAVAEKYAIYSRRAGRLTAEASSLAMSNNYYRQQYIDSFFLPAGGIDLSFSMLPDELAELSVTGNLAAWEEIAAKKRAAIIKKYGDIENYVPIYGGTLTELLLSDRATQIASINRAITSGLIRGKTYREIARGVSGVIGGKTPKGATGAVANAMRIVQTESNRTLNAGAYANSKAVESQGVAMKRMWIASLDTRTRGTHQALDGQTVGVDEPFHSSAWSAMYPGGFGIASQDIGCRCTTIDVVNGIPPNARRGFNSDGNYEVFDWQDYDTWAENQGLVKNAAGKWS